MITFEQAMNIGTIRVKNGYSKDKNTYLKNNRIKDANIQMNGGTHKIKLKDTPEEQTIKTPKNIWKKPTNWVKLTIVSVYPGTNYKDTALNSFIPDLEEHNYINNP